MAGLVACPFCRELFTRAEATVCPACGLSLTDPSKLPPSVEALGLAAEEDDFGIPREPHREPLPMTFLGRSRAALAVASIAGLAFFFTPWVDMSSPEVRTLSGAELAHRLGWLWGAGAAWFVLLPLSLTRRSIYEMRGARVAAAFLAAVPLVTTGILYAFPPHSRYVPMSFSWGWGFDATVATAAFALLMAVRFGGRIDDIRVNRGRVAGTGQTLH